MEGSTVLLPAALWPAGRQKDGPVWAVPGSWQDVTWWARRGTLIMDLGNMFTCSVLLPVQLAAAD